VSSSPETEQNEAPSYADPPGAPWLAANGTEPLEQAETSEERWDPALGRLLDAGPQAFAVIDLDRRIIQANRAFSELVGYSRDELLGMSIFDLTAPQSLEVTHRSHAEVLASGKNERVRKTYRRKDGSLVPVELIVDVLRDDAGQPRGLYAFITDISERARAEAALVEVERRTRALFDGIQDAVFVHDQEGHILDANPAACRQLGYTREELLSMTTSQIDAPEFAAGFQQRLRRQLEEGQLTCEGLHRSKTGRLIPVEVTTSTIQFDSQVAVLAVLRDITERKALERTRVEFAEAQLRNAHEMELKNQALSESETRYRQLAEGSLDAIVVADEDGQITLFNPAAEKIFGYEASAIVGQPLVRLVPGIFESPGEPASVPPDAGVAPAHAPAVQEEPARGDADGASAHSLGLSPIVGRTVELIGRKRDGNEFPLEISLSPVEVNGRPQYISSIRDQTERQRMRAMLALTDKLASIGLLSAWVAHEINNPLAYVLNNLVVLQRDFKGMLELVRLYEATTASIERFDPDAARRIADLIDATDWPYIRDNLDHLFERTRAGVKRVASIVEKMRVLARSSTPQWETVDLASLVESALEIMRGRLHHLGVEVSVQIPALTPVECVPDQISQVLLNLLINALQAIESTGRQRGGRIEVEGRMRGPWLEISVRDNGCGIDPRHRDRLFDPFFTTKPVGEGTGLGLAISHGIVSGHGGRIEIESRPGEGSCFRVLLPPHHSGPPAGSGDPFSSRRPA
jgi:PAS domain S-box-containing protein